jgi:hypothetical protein
MKFKEILLLRPFANNDGTRDSLALPRFSFESDDHPLVSTDRLFRQWLDEETRYQSTRIDLTPVEMKEQDIIVCMSLYIEYQTDKMSRLPGTAHTTR